MDDVAGLDEVVAQDVAGEVVGGSQGDTRGQDASDQSSSATEAPQDGVREGRLLAERQGLPDGPGVYIFYDQAGRVLYVGKSISIRKRVMSHFSAPHGRAADMVGAIERIEFVVTEDEAEALITEQAFIHQHRPRFNVRLRDDKSYPYIGVSLEEDFPRVYFTRERHKRGRRYFGPYSDARRVRETLELLGKVFQYRTCVGPEPGRSTGSPCLDFHIKRCQAPCVAYISQEQYRQNIQRICEFLAGRYKRITKDLEEHMNAAAAAQEYEDAALYRNRLHAVTHLLERKRVASASIGMVDVVAVVVDGVDANAQVFQVRDGVLAERQNFHLSNEAERSAAEVTEEFLMQYYASSGAIPPEVVTSPEFCSQSNVVGTIAQALSDRRGSNVRLRHAMKGDKRRLFELAASNALLALEHERSRAERGRKGRRQALEGLRAQLELDAVPIRIECFDISNLGETNVVASMIVFENGAPKKSDYRRFKLRGLEGQDDFASIAEILGRRVRAFQKQAEFSPHDKDYDASFAALPNLIVIDGGKGQLSSAVNELTELRERGTTVISLAKRLEEVFFPGRSDPLVISHDQPALQMLQRIRDEAHRFAIDYHRLRRDKGLTSSLFDELPGVGPKRKKQLIRHFGSPEAIITASRDQLESVPGLPPKIGREIFHHLQKSR